MNNPEINVKQDDLGYYIEIYAHTPTGFYGHAIQLAKLIDETIHIFNKGIQDQIDALEVGDNVFVRRS